MELYLHSLVGFRGMRRDSFNCKFALGKVNVKSWDLWVTGNLL